MVLGRMGYKLLFGTINLFDIDVLKILAQVDGFARRDFVNKVDPQYGTTGLTLIVNEL